MSKERPIFIDQAAKDINQQEQIIGLKDYIEIFDPNNNLFKAAQLINDGYVGIFASNHQSHADLLAVFMALKKVQDGVDLNKSKGIYFIYAKSIETGHQGEMVKNVFGKFKQILKSIKINPLSVVREKDQQQYGLEPEFNVLKTIISIPDEGSSLFVFPEGTLEGGRKNKEGKAKGLQSASGANTINKLCQICIKKDKGFFALPFTILGSDIVFSPDTNVINPEEKIKVIVGDILFKDDLINQPNQPIDIIMKNIASNLPEERRGVYQ